MKKIRYLVFALLMFVCVGNKLVYSKECPSTYEIYDDTYCCPGGLVYNETYGTCLTVLNSKNDGCSYTKSFKGSGTNGVWVCETHYIFAKDPQSNNGTVLTAQYYINGGYVGSNS